MEYSYQYKQNFADSIIDDNVNMIEKVQLGFAQNGCDIIKIAIANLCADAINVMEVFTEEQQSNFIHFINKFGNE